MPGNPERLKRVLLLAAVLLLALACTLPVGPPPAPTSAPPAPPLVEAASATARPPESSATPWPAETRPAPETELPPATPFPPTQPVPSATPPGELLLTDLNRVPPEDVSREMFVFGGGLSVDACKSPPELAQAALTTRQPDVVVIRFCWDSPGESAYLEVIDPQGRTDATMLPVSGPGSGRFVQASYQVDATRPTGLYTFTLHGLAEPVVVTVMVEPPEYPLMYEVYSNPFAATAYTVGPRHRLHLAGFQPGEALRLWIYRAELDLSLIGWQEIQVDAGGELWITTDLAVGAQDYLGLGVTGPASGEVHLVELRETKMVDSLPGKIECQWAAPSRLVGYGSARALGEVEVFTDPEKAVIKEKLESGEVVRLEVGPQCVDQSWWWFVIREDGRGGFVPELSGGQPWLEPVD